MPQTWLPMSKLDHVVSLTSSDAASKQKATLQQRTTTRKSINTGYNVLFLRRKVARIEKKLGMHKATREINYSADDPFAALVISARTSAASGRYPPYIGSPE